MSVGKFTYVVADIVFAVKPPVKFVAPDTVPPVNPLLDEPPVAVIPEIGIVTPSFLYKLIVLVAEK